MASFSPRFGFSPVSSQPFELAMNTFLYQDDPMHFLDCGQGAAEIPTDGYNEVPLSSYFVEDSDFLQNVGFPSSHGAVPLGPHCMGSSDPFGCIVSANCVNGMSRCETMTPRVLSDSGCALVHCPSLPESYPCLPDPRFSSPEPEYAQAAEPAAQPAAADAGEEDIGTGVRTVGKAKGGTKRAPAQRGGGRKGGVAKARGGRKAAAAAAAVPAAPLSPIYSGVIGGSGQLQAQCLPWTLSLVRLNQQLTGGAPGWAQLCVQ